MPRLVGKTCLHSLQLMRHTALCSFPSGGHFCAWFKACYLQAVKLLTVNSGKCWLLSSSPVVRVSPEESTDSRHVTPICSRRNYLPLFIWMVLIGGSLQNMVLCRAACVDFLGSTSCCRRSRTTLVRVVGGNVRNVRIHPLKKKKGKKKESALMIVISTRSQWYKRDLLWWNTASSPLVFSWEPASWDLSLMARLVSLYKRSFFYRSVSYFCTF